MSVQEFLSVFRTDQKVKITYLNKEEIKEYTGTISYLTHNHHELFSKEIVVSYAKNDIVNILI